MDTKYLEHIHVLILFLLHICYPHVPNSFNAHQVSERINFLIFVLLVVLIFVLVLIFILIVKT